VTRTATTVRMVITCNDIVGNSSSGVSNGGQW
jgi:hypothetical protein